MSVAPALIFAALAGLFATGVMLVVRGDRYPFRFPLIEGT
jgi:hypothetical protein